jgi:hypothetical protein
MAKIKTQKLWIKTLQDAAVSKLGGKKQNYVQTIVVGYVGGDNKLKPLLWLENDGYGHGVENYQTIVVTKPKSAYWLYGEKQVSESDDHYKNSAARNVKVPEKTALIGFQYSAAGSFMGTQIVKLDTPISKAKQAAALKVGEAKGPKLFGKLKTPAVAEILDDVLNDCAER